MSSLQVWFKIQVGNTTRHISTENLFNTPGKKGVEKRALDKLIHKDLGVTIIKTPEYWCRVCSKCTLKIRNDIELLCFVKENINPWQPIAIAAQEEDLNIGETKEQQRWKRMSKSPSSAEKAKSAKIPCTEQQLTLELKRGFRVRKSFSFGQEPVDLNSDSQKEAARLIMTMQMAKRLCGPRMIKSHEAWLKTFFYKSGKTQRTLFSNTQIWSRVLSSKVPSEFKYYCQGTNSILKGTSPKELAAYSNRFVTQEVKVICPFWHASVVGACGVHKSEEKEMKASNAIALATSATSRTRNQRMSALAKKKLRGSFGCYESLSWSYVQANPRVPRRRHGVGDMVRLVWRGPQIVWVLHTRHIQPTHGSENLQS